MPRSAVIAAHAQHASGAAALALGAAVLMLGNTAARADLTEVDGRVVVAPSQIATPARGLSMAQVEARFGAPQSKHPAVDNPPITRWDYPQFTVYFVGSSVIHCVVHDSGVGTSP